MFHVTLFIFLKLRLSVDTEIDWVAYMQQVQTFLNGSRDYDELLGQTGPCV